MAKQRIFLYKVIELSAEILQNYVFQEEIKTFIATFNST